MKYPVNNPRTGAVDYHFPIMETAELQALCQNLRAAQISWQGRGVAARIEALQAWRKVLEQYRQPIVDALTLDTGRYTESVLEMNLLFSNIDRWSGIAGDFFAEKMRKPSAVPFIKIEQAVIPYPLVGVISPWNFPLLLSIIDTIPALVAGCAVVVKPSEVTPRFIEPLMDSIRAVPDLAAVFTYVAGDGVTGADILKEVDLVCFTGSVATGKKVYAAMAAQLKPCFLELGGKDAALVFEGTDLDLAVRSILWGSTVNCGHSCLSIERVYVQEGIFEIFVSKITALAEQIQWARPTPTDGQIGPIIAERQAEIIDAHLADALAKGAQLITGSRACERLDGGLWCRPTVLTHVTHDMKIMTEETFGPIIPIMPFKTEQEALHLANSTIFGLSGAVFAATETEAMRIAVGMEAGAISINDCALTAIIHDGEKNAFRQSGLGGTRMGPGAIKRFMRQRAFLIKEGDVADLWWF